MFVPPINLGQFQPSPSTLADWIYQIWNYLQNNPIATQEQLQEYIATFIITSPETQELIGEGVEQYLTENPPTAPVQSVQGKTGAVQLAYNEIVPASNAVPVYKAASTPSANTLTGQYNLGYRLFVNTATQEIFTISPAGALSLVGRGKFDGTTIDLNSSQGDTTIAESVAENAENIAGNTSSIGQLADNVSAISTVESFSLTNASSNLTFQSGKYINHIVILNFQFNGNGGEGLTLGSIPAEYRPDGNIYFFAVSHTAQDIKPVSVGANGNLVTGANTVSGAIYRGYAFYVI